MFDSFYSTHLPIVSLGSLYRPPARFEYGVAALIAVLPAPANNDGQDCEVLETRMPARFFTIRVLPGTNSIGTPKPRYTVSTGSDMGEMAGQIAIAIRDGMLTFRSGQEDTNG